ncbi:MAG TPA: hypothetical protein VG939_01575 [Caulobacteraceae bacterium]|nr:hypothetical protein [Caulobacteraceae bacterium]
MAKIERMRIALRTLEVLAALSVTCAAAFAQPSTPVARLPLDRETEVGGIEVACTGIGQTRNDPKWLDYSVRVEFSNARSEYLSDAEVTVSDARGRPILAAACDGPWILMKLPKAGYRIEARLLDVPAAPRSASFKAPARGQMRLVLQFKDVDSDAAPPAN